MSTTRRVVRRKECNVVTAEQFNAPGLEAIEPIGPDAPVQYVGSAADPVTGDGERARVLIAVTGPGPGFSAGAG